MQQQRMLGTTRWTFLRLFGVAQVALSMTMIVPGGLTEAREKAYGWTAWLEPPMMGALFLVCGLFGFLVGAVKWKRFERFAFPVLIVPYVALSLVYLLSYLVGAYEHGLISVILYGSIAATVHAASGVMNIPARSVGGDRDGP